MRFPMPHSCAIAFGHIGSTVLACIGIVSAAGYLRGHEARGWFGTATPMAIETALCVALTGLVLFVLTTAIDRHCKRCHRGE